MFPDQLCDDVFRLETARLWLRWPRTADAPALSALAGDADVAEMTASIPYPYTEADAARWIFSSRTGNAQGSSLVLVLARRGKPTEAIGAVGLHRTRPGAALLGYWLGAPFQGKGFTTEAVQGVVELAFQVAEVREIHAQVRIENERSRRVLDKCGFRSDGVGQVDLPARGGVFTCERFRLDQNGWAGRSHGPYPRGETARSAAVC